MIGHTPKEPSQTGIPMPQVPARLAVAAGLVAGLAVLGGGAAQAHDPLGLMMMEGLDDETRQTLEEIQALRDAALAEATANNDQAGFEFVIRNTATWEPGAIVQVCFFEGDQTLRRQIADVMNEWTNFGDIGFDFGPADNIRTCDGRTPTDIRISFSGVGHWSYIGKDALRIAPAKQTLNLENYDDQPPVGGAFNYYILHETGHALGLEHEHQSKFSTCEEEFDWPAVYRGLSSWSKEKVDHNMKRLAPSASLTISEYDRASVMHYSLPPRFFKQGQQATCFVRLNTVLSKLDKEAMAIAYPRGSQESPIAVPANQALVDAVEKIRNLQEAP